MPKHGALSDAATTNQKEADPTELIAVSSAEIFLSLLRSINGNRDKIYDLRSGVTHAGAAVTPANRLPASLLKSSEAL